MYRNKLIGIPTPEFYAFYNGNEKFPTEKILKLSDAYLDKDKKGMLELEVKIININLSEEHPFLKSCRPMYEYSYFVDRIKTGITAGNDRDEAIKQAMVECEKKGILADFIKKHGAEVSNMLYTEFNMEDALEIRGEEKFEEGKAEGKAEAIIEILKEYGEVAQELQRYILDEEDGQLLNHWLKLSIRAGSIDGFKQKAQIEIIQK